MNVEMAGLTPASGHTPHNRLHVYPIFVIRAQGYKIGKTPPSSSLFIVRTHPNK